MAASPSLVFVKLIKKETGNIFSFQLGKLLSKFVVVLNCVLSGFAVDVLLDPSILHKLSVITH